MLVVDQRGRLNPVQRGEIKIQVVMKWIAEWTFSSIELLSATVGQPPSSTTAFFKKLIDEGYLVRFSSKVYHRKDWVRIGATGVKYLLDNYGIDARRYMRSDEIARKKKLYHDYQVQLYAAYVQHFYTSVHSEINIRVPKKKSGNKKPRKPDALFFILGDENKLVSLDKEVAPPAEFLETRSGLSTDPDYFWWNKFGAEAVEFETEAKKPKIVKDIFRTYFYLMLQGKVSKVHFIFDNPSHVNTYQRHFDAERWGDHISISSDHPIRKLFSFSLLMPDAILTLLTEKKWVDDVEFFTFSR